LVAKGLSAVQWASVISDKVGGKKGGKDESAQGSGTDAGQADIALEAAVAFAKLKLA
jgi:alanyl-tRNA synthetase